MKTPSALQLLENKQQDSFLAHTSLYLGEVQVTDEDVVIAPPHRVEHEVIICRPRSSDIATERNANNPGRLGGRRKTSAVHAHPGFLNLALLHLSEPSNGPASREGELAVILQSEQESMPARVNALKASVPT